MMGSYILGLILAIVVIGGSIFEITEHRALFFSIEGLVIVIGGTCSAALLTFPLRKLTHLVKVVFIVFRKQVDSGPDVVREIVTLARDTRGDHALLAETLPTIRNLFLRDGIELILERIDIDRLEVILRDRLRVKQDNDESISNMLKTLGKYPPAFGLLATVISLIALLDGLGSGSMGAATLGPSMAAGLAGTMYGLVLSNLFFMPMSENLLLKSILDLRNRQMTMIGILLIQSGESPRVIQESLNSMLDISLRVDVLQRSNEEAA